MLRIRSGLSTFEQEIGRLGRDWREVFEQRLREQEFLAELGLEMMLPDMMGVEDKPSDGENRDTNNS